MTTVINLIKNISSEKDFDSELINKLPDITYNDDLIFQLEENFSNNYEENYYKLKFIKNNYKKLKKIFPNIGTIETNILFITLKSMIYLKYYSNGMDILIFVCENFKSSNPFIYFDNSFYNDIKKYVKKKDWLMFEFYLGILVYYKYEISDDKKNEIKEKTTIDVSGYDGEAYLIFMTNFIQNIKEDCRKNEKRKKKN